MNDYRGLLIKKERKKQDISLEALAYGICSPSYLSKIENNILIADDEIYKLIFQKLGIQMMDKKEENDIEKLLDLFFQYYMTSNLKVINIMDKLLEFKDEVSTSSLFVPYQLFLLFASEMNSKINISLSKVENFYSYMNDQQKAYFDLYALSSGKMTLEDNDEWTFIRITKARANIYAYKKNILKAYDLYKLCLNYATELGNKTLTAEILCALGWLCLDVDLKQAEQYYTSAVYYDTQYKSLAYYNLGATMIQYKDDMKKGIQYLNKGLKTCTDDQMKMKYKEAIFIYSILDGDRITAKQKIKELEDSKYIDVFLLMLNEDYQLNENYQCRLKELKKDSSLFKFLFIKNCEYLHKYKEICIAKGLI